MINKAAQPIVTLNRGDVLRPVGRVPQTDCTGSAIAHPAATLLGFFVGVSALCAASAIWFDGPVARYALSKPPIRATALLVSDLGLSGYMLVGSAALALCAWGLRRRAPFAAAAEALALLAERALFVFAAVAVSGLLVQLLKHGLGRARPTLMDRVGTLHFDPLSIKASLASFPSGHATSIFALALALALMLPRWRWPLFTVALLVAASRTLVGSHYVSDVIAGAGLGSAVAFLLGFAFARRNLVFVRSRDVLRLKGRGQVRPALQAALQSVGPRS